MATDGCKVKSAEPRAEFDPPEVEELARVMVAYLGHNPDDLVWATHPYVLTTHLGKVYSFGNAVQPNPLWMQYAGLAHEALRWIKERK